MSAALAEMRVLAMAAAKGAGQLLRQCFGKQPAAGLTRKGSIDLVTDADRASERFLIDALRARFPDHEILSEETGRVVGRGPLRWIIDPLDGTTNFAHGIPHFAVLLAAQETGSGDVVLAVTYDPLRDELFVAQRGDGATLNGAPLHVSATGRLIDAVLATGFAYDRLTQGDGADNHREFCRLNLLTQGVRRMGAAGLDLAYVACGRFDAFWESGLKAWDMAGGMLLVIEAGGRCSDCAGGSADSALGQVAASNGILHPVLLQSLATARQHPTNSREELLAVSA